ncbi:hypothetical protein D9M71_758780 [compost metagenome]
MAMVNSGPLIHCSTSTCGSWRRASCQAASNCSKLSTRAMPMLEPSWAGLTISGKPSSAAARSQSAALASTAWRGVGRPRLCHTCLVRSLSMASAEASTPLPV